MGFFDNLIKSTDKVENSLKINWLALTDKAQLEDIIKISIGKPVLIFKHSTRCGISRMVLKNFESDYDIPETEIDMYFLDLLEYRTLSNDISEKFKVAHQSPQVLVIKKGEVIYHDSHDSITVETTKEVIAR
jgi:bacillithiol system protein YtxJ